MTKKIPKNEKINNSNKEDKKIKKSINDIKYRKILKYSNCNWISEKTQKNVGFKRLHHELLDFYEFIRPKEEDNIKRIKTIMIIDNIINNKWSYLEVKAYGSYPNKLHLIDSDIDLGIVNKLELNNSKYDLKTIYNELLKYKIFDSIYYVDARVPIIKLKCKETQIKVDISITNDN